MREGKRERERERTDGERERERERKREREREKCVRDMLAALDLIHCATLSNLIHFHVL